MADVSRQARARALLRAQFVAEVMEPARAESAECSLRPREFVSVQSGNCGAECEISGTHLMVDACTSVFADLLVIADDLIHLARSQLYDSLLLYGEDADHLLERDGGVVEMMSGMLPSLHALGAFVHRCERVASALLRQLHALFDISSSGQQQPQGGGDVQQQQLSGARDLQMGRVWRSMGDLISTLIVLDEVIRAHPFLQQHWHQFVRSIRLAQHNPSQFELHAQSGRLQQLNAEIVRLDTELMGGNIFKTCCQRVANSIQHLPADRAFLDRFRRTIMDSLQRWERQCSASEDAIPDKQRLLALIALAQLYHALLLSQSAGDSNAAKLKTADRKMLRALCATHKRVVTFHLVGDLLFTPVQHIASAFATLDAEAVDRKTLASVAQARAVLLDHQVEQMTKEAQMFEHLVSGWGRRMDDFGDCPPSNGDSDEQIVTRKCALLFEGAHFADKIGRLLKCILNGHLAENRALTKQNARLLFRLVQHNKQISDTLNQHWVAVLEWSQRGCANAASTMLRVLEVQMRSGGGAKNGQALAALHNAQLALTGAPNARAIIRCVVALEMANYTKLLRPLDAQLLDDQLGRLDLLWNLGSLLHRVADMSFLFWHRQSLCDAFCVALLQPQQETEPHPYSIKHFFDALNDCTHHLLPNVAHCDPDALRTELFSHELFAILKEKFLDRLCTQIENDLRLSYHSQQSSSLDCMEKQLFGHQDEQQTSQLGELTTQRLFHLLHITRFQLGDQLVDVKAYVTAHLESTFYNLSVLALHDCDSYRRMALLAELRYKLRLADAGLPNMSVDQGLDMLAIMSDPEQFVASYCYDVREQFFIERDSQGKQQLNIVRVQQVVNSIKTHGLGIANTLLNSAYKYLRAQFQRLSRCLFDERVKALLMQEIRFYRDAVDELDQMYPMSRADKLANVLRRYESSAFGGGAGSDFLEKFRVLVTRIGNMLGLLRLVRTGFVEFCAPVLMHRRKTQLVSAIDQMEEQQQNAVVHAECAQLRDRALQNAWANLQDTNDCIEKLTAVFSREFRSNSAKYAHLRHLFIAIPPLTLSHVEHSMASRARLMLVSGRRGVVGVMEQQHQQDGGGEQLVFVEDGFSMGVAYLLTLLGQRFFFDSLNWFESVKRRFHAELAQCGKEQKEAQKRKDESLARVLAVKTSQLEERMADHRLLSCTLNSALTLFQANELLGDEDGEETFLEDF